MSNETLSKSNSLSAVFQHIDVNREVFLQRLFEYLRIPGISTYGEGINESAVYISNVLRSIGLECDVIPTDGWPMVFAQHVGHPELPTILLYGHYDVQPPDPLEAWDSPPFEPEVRDGRIYARGVGDNRGQHLAQILAIESWLKTSGELPCNVKILLEGEEEIGSPQMASFAHKHRELLQSDLVVTADGPVHPDGQSTIVFGSRGTLSFELRAQGANRDFHSGKGAGVLPNPVWTLVHLLASIRDKDGKILIDGFYDDVEPRPELELAAWADLPFDADEFKLSLGVTQFDAPAERSYFDRISAWPALNVSGFTAGYSGPGMKAVLPHKAVVKGDFRLVESQRADDIFAKLVTHVQSHSPEVEVIRHYSFEPSKTPLDSEFVEPLRRAVIAAQGVNPLLVPNHPGSLPNYIFTKHMGTPAFVIPYANHDERNHAPNENLELERFYLGIKTGAAMLAEVGRMKNRGERK